MAQRSLLRTWPTRLGIAAALLLGGTGIALADGIYMTNMKTNLTQSSINLLTDSARTPGAQDGDIVEYVLQSEVVNAAGGPGVYFTAYIPSGVEVLGAWFVTDATGSNVFTSPAMPVCLTTGTTPGAGGCANDGWGSRGSVTPFGNPFSGIGNSRQSDLYGDTGVFYSTDSRTQFFTSDGSDIAKGTWTGKPSAAGNGYNVTDTFYGTVDAWNIWDANQVNAFGAGGTLNAVPANTTSTATVINSKGQGSTPYGSGSAVAGPDTGYTLDNTGSVGPWQRIQYPGSKKANTSDGPATATGNANSPTVVDVSAVGRTLGDSNPLPSTTNAVRWSYGLGLLNQNVYVKIRVRIKATALSSNKGVILNFESNGSDNWGSGSKDNPWRYFGPTVAQSASLFIKKEVDKVNGVAYAGGAIPAGATVTYRIRYLNLGNLPVTNVTLKDTLSTAIATTGCSVANPTFSNLSNSVTVSTVSSGTATCPAAGATVTFGNAPNVNSGTLSALRGGAFTYDVKLSSSIASGTTVSNTGTFSGQDAVSNVVVTQTSTAQVTVRVAPTIDLDGNDSSGATGNNFNTSFTLGGSAIGIVDTNTPSTETQDTVITDSDSTQLSGAVVNLTNAQTGDSLAVSGTLPTGVTLDPSSTTSRIVLTGAASLANYEAALEQVKFSTTSGSLSNRTITVQVTDDTNLPSNLATTTVGIVALDYGDAPNDLTSIDAALSNIYPSASHTLDGLTYLGDRVDADSANQPSINADGDDNAGTPSDEDGVTFPLAGTNRILNSGQTNTLTVKASRAGILNAWIDWNQDGDWNDPGEQIALNVNLAAGNNTLTVAVPNTAPHGATYARFRFSTAANLGPTGGPAINGEVEDYKVNIVLPAPVACASGLLNNGFEQPLVGGSSPAPFQDFGNGGIASFREADVPWWGTVANSSTSGANFDQRNAIELWKKGNAIQGTPFEGNQFAEINAYVAGQLYQDLAVPPGTQIRWQVAHRGRSGTDTFGVFIGSPGSEVSQGSYATPSTEWRVYSGLYTVPTGQYITRFGLRAISTAGGDNSVGNFVDDVRLSNFCAPTVQGFKSVKLTTDTDNNGKISPGDILTYTLYYANGSSASTGPTSGFQINDPLPSGLTITAPGSQIITVSGGLTYANKNPSYTGAAAGAVSNLLNPGALLDVGGLIRVDIPVKVDATASGTLLNQGTSSALEFFGQNVKTDNTDNTNTGLPGGITIPIGSLAQTQTPAIEPTQVAVINPAFSSNPNLILVKRITAVTGSSGAIQGGDNIAQYKDETSNPYDDNDITITTPNPPTVPADTNKWPGTGAGISTFLLGAVNGGSVGPKDEVEYTIYFLSTGSAPASEVTICDRIPSNQTFIADGYNSLAQVSGGNLTDRGIAVSYAGQYYSYTNLKDGDTAQYYAPKTSLPGACGPAANDTGAVVVNLGTGATNALGGTVPKADTPGSPNTSYGFIRFKAKVQ